MEKENLNQSEIEKDIQKSIDEIKREDVKPWPEKKYVKFEKTKITPLSSANTERQKQLRKDKIQIFVLMAANIILILACCIFLAQSKTIPKDKTEPVVAEVGSQVIHNIKFEATHVERQNKNLVLDVAVSNKSENDFYVTIRSMVLVDDKGTEYLPNVYLGDIPTKFFGEKILPKENKTAKIVFENIPETNKLTLVASNVSDTYHFMWDYMITLP